MQLPRSLISEFVKIARDTPETSTETTVYGSIVKNGDNTYVQLDGSEVLTPVTTTTDTEDGERVTVLIKNHTATVTGNITSPAARTATVTQLSEDKLDVNSAVITYATIENLDAANARIGELEVTHGKFETLTVKNFEAVNANIDSLEAAQGNFETLTAENFEAVDAKINNLVVGDLDAEYANIDFSNIGKAAMEYFYSQSGLIENVVVSDGTITGNLLGVTIKGDLIEGNTVVADKLVILGQNGLYYKLNTDGVTIEAEQTEYNSLNGTHILAKSITATKISVDDLVAFDATIGGFNIATNALYSGVKESINNTTRGIYLDKDGQVAFGDSSSYLKYYKTSDGSYKLDISLSGSDLGSSINDAAKTATNYLSYDAALGLQVGDKSGGTWSGYRARMASSAFEILDSDGEAVASYGAQMVELGKNTDAAVIKLCNNNGRIEYVSDGSDNFLQLSADKLRLKSKGLTSVYAAETTSSGDVNKSAVNVMPGNVYVYSGSSNMSITSKQIDIASPGDIVISAASLKDSHGEFLSVSEGTSGVWSYKKWSNGDAELWGSYTVSGVTCTTSLGAMYRSSALTMPAFPFSVYTPNLTASYESNGYGAMLWATSTTTQTNPPSYYLLRPESGTIASGKINFHVFGKWIT